VVPDEQVGAAGLQPRCAFDQDACAADPERPDQRDLKPTGDDLLGSLAGEPGYPLQRIEDQQDSSKGDQEGNRGEPIEET